jgi:hypothetical protein
MNLMTRVMIGMIELRGVRSSWATEEKNFDRIFLFCDSSFLSCVMSVQTTKTCVPSLKTEVFTYMYLLSYLDLKICNYSSYPSSAIFSY